jgi:hypothetical protein
VNMQLYWHTVTPSYPAFQAVPENRVYVSADRADALIRSFLAFSKGKVVSDNRRAGGEEIGLTSATYRRVRIESVFGKLTISVTDGHLPYPYGRETTGYEVADLSNTLAKGVAAGVVVLREPQVVGDRREAMVEFPGGYVAEIHSLGVQGGSPLRFSDLHAGSNDGNSLHCKS